MVALLLCVLIYCILFYGRGIIEHSKLADSLTTATQLDLFSVFYLSHLGVFSFLFVLSISLSKYNHIPGKKYLFLQLCLCTA